MTAPRALTWKQPWATDVVEGWKTVENRTRNTRHRGWVLVHAGKRNARGHRTKDIAHLPHGAVIGLVDIIGCHRVESGAVTAEGTHLAISCCPTSSGAMSHGQYARATGAPDVWPADLWHWELANPVRLREPIEWDGREGLWVPPDKLLALVEEAR